jgi:hypothetical protein
MENVRYGRPDASDADVHAAIRRAIFLQLDPVHTSTAPRQEGPLPSESLSDKDPLLFP